MLPDEQTGGEAAVIETTEEAAPEAAVLSPEGESPKARDFDAEARAQGWVPEAEFKGNKRPAKFLSAEDFVERGEYADRIEKRTADRINKEYEGRFAKLEKVTTKTVAKLQEQHEAEITALNVAKDAAIEKGDVAGVRKIEKDIAKAEANAPDAAVAEPEKAPATPEELFLKDNPWFGEDDDLADLATGYSQRLLKNEPKITLEENLARTAKYMREKYPLKTNGKTGANGHAPVDSGALNGGAPQKDPLASLPAEARAQAKKDMANLPKIYPTAAAWLKVYQS